MDAIASAVPEEQVRDRRRRCPPALKHKPKNVEGLLFREQEAGYLVGYAAGMYAKANHGKAVGSVGGLKIPPVDRYIAGFQYGAKKADPGIKTLNGYSQRLREAEQVQGSGTEPDRPGLRRRVPGRRPVRPRRARCVAREGYLRCRRRRRPGLPRLVGDDERAQARRRRRLQRDPGCQPRQACRSTNKQFDAKIGGIGYGKWSQTVPASIKSAVAAQFAKLKAGQIKGIPTTVK